MPNTPPRTWIDFDWAALRANAEVVARIARPAGLLPVIKANAYGHSPSKAASALRGLASDFAVANLREAADLQASGGSENIVLLGPCLPEERGEALRRNLIVTVSGHAEASDYLLAGRSPRLHFKIDTGMGRLGAWREEGIADLERLAAEGASEKVDMISTHLPCADGNPRATSEQLEWFRCAVERLRPRFPKTRFHALNSAGIFRFPEFAFDLVRPGIVLYGISPTPGCGPTVRPVMAWRARIVLVREFPAGRMLSYGGEFETTRPSRIAVLPVGYADGYFRQIPSGTARVLIRGARCPVVGRITMDMILADVTDLPGVGVGEVATLLGRDGADEISAVEIAGWAGTIPWHVLTALGHRPHLSEYHGGAS